MYGGTLILFVPYPESGNTRSEREIIEERAALQRAPKQKRLAVLIHMLASRRTAI